MSAVPAWVWLTIGGAVVVLVVVLGVNVLVTGLFNRMF